MNKNSENKFHIHLVSDATGETINSIARACLAQFETTDVEEHHWSLIRTKRQLDFVYEGLRQWPGLVLYTFVDNSLRESISDQCARMGLPCHSVLDPILVTMSTFFGAPISHAPGKQHVLDADYFSRIDAMDFAIAFDDGHQLDRLETADVVLLGVSRTSKTPTAIYLSHRGIRVANIPIVLGVDIPYDLKQLEKPLIVGLTKDPETLVDVRRARLKFLQEEKETDYVNLNKIKEEQQQARRIFSMLNCPVIDVTHRSIEETAANIMMMIKRREMERDIETTEREKNGE